MNEVENTNELQQQKSAKRPVLFVVAGVLLVIIVGVVIVVMLQTSTTKQPASSSDTKKAISLNRAESANTAAKDLMKEAEKLGNDEKAFDKMREAIKKFADASDSYKAAGDVNASTEAHVNAEITKSSLEVSEAAAKKIQEDRAKQVEPDSLKY